jgi:hypothetical protein
MCMLAKYVGDPCVKSLKIAGLILGYVPVPDALAWAELAADVRSTALSMKYWGACVSAPQGNPHVIKKHTACI